LKGFEHIKGVILESCPFDIEKDLVTATLKKKRNKLVSHYRVNKWNNSLLVLASC
jgi:long-chain acyl-CoA synthetase